MQTQHATSKPSHCTGFKSLCVHGTFHCCTMFPTIFAFCVPVFLNIATNSSAAYTASLTVTSQSITFHYTIIVKLLREEAREANHETSNIKIMLFYQKIPHMGTSMPKALMLEKTLKNMGTNMLLSWKTHFFEPSAHF